MVWYEIVFRLFLAIILSGIIGFERELHGRPAGLRTHVLVALGAALVMLISIDGFGGSGDPARLAAQVVSGIGFLGAGAILRDGGDIKGITTAATLWIVGMIGLACGNGYYVGKGYCVTESFTDVRDDLNNGIRPFLMKYDRYIPMRLWNKDYGTNYGWNGKRMVDNNRLHTPDYDLEDFNTDVLEDWYYGHLDEFWSLSLSSPFLAVR